MTVGRVRLGIDALLSEPGRYVRGRRVGLATNGAALTGNGVPTVEALRAHPDLELRTLFTFEHGLSGFGEDARPVDDAVDPRSGLSLHSLYGPRRRPDPAVLQELRAAGERHLASVAPHLLYDPAPELAPPTGASPRTAS